MLTKSRSEATEMKETNGAGVEQRKTGSKGMGSTCPVYLCDHPSLRSTGACPLWDGGTQRRSSRAAWAINPELQNPLSFFLTGKRQSFWVSACEIASVSQGKETRSALSAFPLFSRAGWTG